MTMQTPEYVRAVLARLDEGGRCAYLVGGCVRDLVMGRVPQDWDIAVSARPEDVAKLFPRTIPTGIRHGTVTIVTEGGHVEVTSFRRDGVYTDHRQPEQVIFVEDLAQDLARRDFTMNAMAMDQDCLITDPFGGQADIAARLIRCVGDPGTRFEEDALRMLRALRFSAQLDFTVDVDTMTAIRKKHDLAKTLSAERVRNEIAKILASPRPEVLADVLDCGLLTAYITHSAANQTLRAKLSQIQGETPLRWATLTAILAEGDIITSPEVFLRALRLDNQTVRLAGTAADLGPDLPTHPTALKHLLSRHGVEPITLATQVAELFGYPEPGQVLRDIFQSGDCFSLDQLALSGDDLLALGIVPGRQVGDILQTLLAHVFIHPDANERGTLLKLAEKQVKWGMGKWR